MTKKAKRASSKRNTIPVKDAWVEIRTDPPPAIPPLPPVRRDTLEVKHEWLDQVAKPPPLPAKGPPPIPREAPTSDPPPSR